MGLILVDSFRKSNYWDALGFCMDLFFFVVRGNALVHLFCCSPALLLLLISKAS